MADLDGVRGRIRRIDAEIVRLVGERVAAAAEAGSIKRSAGLPIRDYEAERAVVDHMRQGVAERAVDPELGERVARLLIEASIRVQEDDARTTTTPVHAAHGTGRRAVVIGGAGKMGAWFAQFLASRGLDVSTSDPAGPLPGYAHEPDARKAAADADIVVVSVPPDQTGPVLRTLDGGNGLVLDVASIKGPFVDDLRRLARTRSVASIHPLWGANTRVLSGKNLLVLDCGDPAAADKAAALFEGTAARVHRLPVEAHDAVMAHTLGLPHALNLVFGEVLLASRKGFGDLRAFGGPTFLKQAAVAAEVASENREMYRQIQHLNPHTPEIYAAVKAAVDHLERRLADPRAFAQRMAEYDNYFARFKEWWP